MSFITAAQASFAQSLVIERKLGETSWVHSSLADFADLGAAQGRPERAVRLAGAVAVLCERVGAVLQPTERVRFELWLQAARQALSDDEAEAPWAAGRAMSLEQAIAEALEKGA